MKTSIRNLIERGREMRWSILIPSTFGFVFFIGCSHAWYVAPNRVMAAGDTVTIELFNERMANRDVIVSTHDELEFSAFAVTMTRDSCTFFDRDRMQPGALSLGNVRSVKRVDHVGGAMGGLGFGLLGGLAVGGALALSGPSGGDRGMGTGYAALSAVTLGSVVGLVVGGIRGTTIEYEFLGTNDSIGAHLSPSDSTKPTVGTSPGAD
jgi:hypothetical protein